MADNDSRSGTTYLTDDLVRYLDELHVPQDAANQQACVNLPTPDGMLLGLKR